MFRGLEKFGNAIVSKGDALSGGTLTAIKNSANKLIQGKSPRDVLKNGNVVQFISKVTGRSLEIVTSANGQLVVDGVGPQDANAFHAHFTVIQSHSHNYSFHNNFNYLAMVNGSLCIRNYPPSSEPGRETAFRVHDIIGSNSYVALESVVEPGRYVAIQPNGIPKFFPHASQARGNEEQFSILLAAYAGSTGIGAGYAPMSYATPTAHSPGYMPSSSSFQGPGTAAMAPPPPYTPDPYYGQAPTNSAPSHPPPYPI